MLNVRARWRWFFAACLCHALVASAQGLPFVSELANIQRAFAAADALQGEQKVSAFAQLTDQVRAFSAAYPMRAEPLVWEAVTLTFYAGAKRGFSAIGMINTARDKLEAAEKLDPAAFDWAASDFLATLYWHTPGWPFSFGDEKQARHYFEKAIAAEPRRFEPKYFYGQFLFDRRDYATALQYLDGAVGAGADATEPGATSQVCNAMMCPRSKEKLDALMQAARDLLAKAREKSR